MNLKTKFRDWLRGYSGADVQSLERKLEADVKRKKVGRIVPLTGREWCALAAQFQAGSGLR